MILLDTHIWGLVDQRQFRPLNKKSTTPLVPAIRRIWRQCDELLGSRETRRKRAFDAHCLDQPMDRTGFGLFRHSVIAARSKNRHRIDPTAPTISQRSSRPNYHCDCPRNESSDRYRRRKDTRLPTHKVGLAALKKRRQYQWTLNLRG